jgi:hypothetical protein
VLVRHNTTLLEQAIDLQVKRSAIPTLQAEAAAHDKIARASGFRRLATGAAIAIAAIGIGIGVWLIFDRDKLPGDTETANEQKTPPATEDREIPSKEDEPDPVPEPIPSEPAPPPQEKEATPDQYDFEKFITTTIQFQGETWELVAGHHFKDEKDPNFQRAWCYTRRLVNGIDINVDIATRETPTAKPFAPVAAPETLATVGLNDDLALQLATKCKWIDRAIYASTDFAERPGRPKPQAPVVDELVVQEGWDALGNDLPSIPVTGLPGLTFDQCQSRCDADQQCGALTYDRKNSVCFLKSGASVLIANAGATMASRRSIEGSLKRSSLVLTSNTVQVGNGYMDGVTTYVDCVMSCATDLRCRAFNFDASKLCTLLDSVRSSSSFKGVTSGRKNGPD